MVLRDTERLRAAGRQIYDEYKRLRSAVVHRLPVQDYSRFADRDLTFYESTQLTLEAADFERIGDYERVFDPPPEELQDHTFLRAMVRDDGWVVAGFSHSRQDQRSRLLSMDWEGFPASWRTIEFSTEFGDGSFLCTDNCLNHAYPHDIPGIRTVMVARSADIRGILRRHEAEFAQTVQKQSSLAPRSVLTMEDFFAACSRQREMECRYFRSIGYISDAEVRWTFRNLNLPSAALRHILDGVYESRATDVAKPQP